MTTSSGPSFRLVNKAGKTAPVGWFFIAGVNQLNVIEADLAKMSDKTFTAAGVSRSDLTNAIDMLRQLPIHSGEQLMEGGDVFLSHQTEKCYVFPCHLPFRATATPIPCGPSSQEALGWWEKSAQFGAAFQCLYNGLYNISQELDPTQPSTWELSYRSINMFETTRASRVSIKRGTFDVQEITGDNNSLLNATGFVVYAVYDDGVEGYLDRESNLGPFSAVRIHDTLQSAQKKIQVLQSGAAIFGAASFEILEVKLSIEAPVARVGVPRSDSAISQALSVLQHQVITSEVEQVVSSDLPASKRKI